MSLTAPEIEKSVLSMLFQWPEEAIPRAVAMGLKSEHFSSLDHATLFKELISRFNDEKPLDLVSLTSTLPKDTLETIGGAANMTVIYTHAPTLGMWSAHTGILVEKFGIRQAILYAEKLTEAAESGCGTDVLQAAQEAQEAVVKAFQQKKLAVAGRPACVEWFRHWQGVLSGKIAPGIGTGLFCVDATTGGLKPKELWIIGGDTSKGKSVLALQLASEALRQKRRVAIFSLEMGVKQVVGRMTCYLSGLEFGKLTMPDRYMHQEEGPRKADELKMASGLKLIAESKLEIVDEADLSIDTICALAQQLNDIEHMDLVIVDYIQLVEGRRQKQDSREREVASISAGLKQLAKRLDCPVIGLSQLNEDGKLRESRTIGQDANVTLFITDDGILVGKNRDGESGAKLPLVLNGLHQRFEEIAGQ